MVDPIAFRLHPSDAFHCRFAATLLKTVQRCITECRIEALEMEETFGYLAQIRPQLAIPVIVQLYGPRFLNGRAAQVSEDASYWRIVKEEGRAIAQADAVIAPSRDTLARTREYYQLPLEGAAVIPLSSPAVAPDARWRLADCDPKRILFVGRFDRHKGGDVVIDAMRLVNAKHPDVRLWFVGPERRFIDEQKREWTLGEYIAHRAPGLSKSIDYLNVQPHATLNDFRRRAFVTLVASRYETFGLVVTEAMTCGCPLIASRTDGISETVVDGTHGLLFEPGNAQDLAAKIGCLLQDPSLAVRLGAQAGEHAHRNYHPDLLARQIAAFHRKVIDDYPASINKMGKFAFSS
jgi:glycosyltransferase involved in cell wall biosynthesis